MGKITAGLFISLSLLLTTTESRASSLTVNVFDPTYATAVSTRAFDTVTGTPTSDSRTTQSANPISDSLEFVPRISATASASTFELFVHTIAGDVLPYSNNRTTASAETGFSFSPLTNGTSTLVFDFLGEFESLFSDGSVSLLDVTANEQLFNFGWNCCTLPPPFAYPINRSASLAVEQMFSADHVYQVSMFTKTYGNGDQQSMSVRLSGLQAVSVPDPPTVILLVAGALGLFGIRRRNLGPDSRG